VLRTTARDHTPRFQLHSSATGRLYSPGMGFKALRFSARYLAGQIEYEMQVLVMIVLFIVLSRNKLRRL